jgi:hypothetical protein
MTKEEKIFSCDDELVRVLKKQRFKEITGSYDKSRDKRKFQRGNNVILFDYINLIFFQGNHTCQDFGGYEFSYDDLQLLFWYLNSSAADKEIISSGYFLLHAAKETLEHIRFELRLSAEFGIKNRNTTKWQRFANNFETVTLID